MYTKKGHTIQCGKWLKSELCKMLNMTIEELKTTGVKMLEQEITSDGDYSGDRERGIIEISGVQYLYWYFHCMDVKQSSIIKI